MSVIRLLAISGSLRNASSSGALVKAAARLAPAGVEVAIYEKPHQLPPFNPIALDPQLAVLVESAVQRLTRQSARLP